MATNFRYSISTFAYRPISHILLILLFLLQLPSPFFFLLFSPWKHGRTASLYAHRHTQIQKLVDRRDASPAHGSGGASAPSRPLDASCLTRQDEAVTAAQCGASANAEPAERSCKTESSLTDLCALESDTAQLAAHVRCSPRLWHNAAVT